MIPRIKSRIQAPHEKYKEGHTYEHSEVSILESGLPKPKEYFSMDAVREQLFMILEENKSKVTETFQRPLQKRAVCFDIDATVLNMVDDDHVSRLGLFDMYFVYEHAKKLHYDIFFITARPNIFIDEVKQSNILITQNQLQELGFTEYKGLFLMPAEITDYTYENISEYKRNARKFVVNLGYTIVLSCGDQWSDLLTPLSVYQANPEGNKKFEPMYDFYTLEDKANFPQDKPILIKTPERGTLWGLKLPADD